MLTNYFTLVFEDFRCTAFTVILIRGIRHYVSQIKQKFYEENKQAYYLSAEYLMGRALGNNLISLGLYEEVEKSSELRILIVWWSLATLRMDWL